MEPEMYDYTSSNWSHWNSNEKLKENLEAVSGKHSIDSLQKTAILGTSHIIRKVLQCEAWSLSGGDHCWFKKITGKNRPVTRDIIVISRFSTLCYNDLHSVHCVTMTYTLTVTRTICKHVSTKKWQKSKQKQIMIRSDPFLYHCMRYIGVKFQRRNGTKITALNCTNLINNYSNWGYKSHPNTLPNTHAHRRVYTPKEEKFIKYQGPR